MINHARKFETSSNSLIRATIDELMRHAPFDQMLREHVSWLAQRLTLSFHAKGDLVLLPEKKQPAYFYLIKQGVIQAEQDVVRGQDDVAWLELHAGECFPLGALLSNRPVTGTYRAQESTFCYQLPAADFLHLTQLSEAFHDFCTRRIANLLEQSKLVIQAQYTRSSTEQQSMSSPLAFVIRREPVTCAPQTSVREVLATMHQLGIGSMVAVEEGRPLGIFTLHDVLNRVALARIDLDRPIIGIMSTRLATLPPQVFAYEAALAMARHGIRHVLVTADDGKLMGVVSEKDLFSLQRVGLRQISNSIRAATDVEQLRRCAQDIRQLAHNMMAQGVAAGQLTQIISSLNDLLTCRVIDMECAALRLQDRALIEDRFCWLAFGSEGRLEQTLNTDQDNGIVFAPPPDLSAEEMRRILVPLALRINDTLDACGFPRCTGGVMASNPAWCLSRDEWQHTFGTWIEHGDPEALLNATIFFDFRALHGQVELADSLREWLAGAAARTPRFLHQMAANALGNRPPLGWVRDFSLGEDHAIDLKLNGIAPFVDAARIFSLATGGIHTATLQRLHHAGKSLQIPASEIEAWEEAFLFIQLLRLRLQHDQIEAEQTMSNRVDPNQLNDLDRRILKEAFRQARKLQSRLALSYKL